MSLAEILTPLREQQVQVLVPPYVNTFPLGFHASIAKATVGIASWEASRLSPVNELRPIVLYTYPQKAKSWQSSGGWWEESITEVASQYSIRRVFAKWADGSPVDSGLSLEHLVQGALENAILEVFSDISNQADHLIRLLAGESGVNSPRLRRRYNVPAFANENDVDEKRLELVICSAPMAHYYGTLQTFVEVAVPEYESDESRSYFDLVVVVIPGAMDGTHLKQVRRALADYHVQLYAQYGEASPDDLRAVCDCYTRTVRGRLLFAPVSDPTAFKHVLLSHHQAPV